MMYMMYMISTHSRNDPRTHIVRGFIRDQNEQACKPGSVRGIAPPERPSICGPPLPTGSSHLLGAAGPACMLPFHGVAPDRVYSVHMSPCDGWALTPPFHPYRARRGGISLLHLSEGHPWRALPVILALWSPDFPHAQPFGSCPRSFGLLMVEADSPDGPSTSDILLIFRYKVNNYSCHY